MYITHKTEVWFLQPLKTVFQLFVFFSPATDLELRAAAVQREPEPLGLGFTRMMCQHNQSASMMWAQLSV